MYKKNTLLLYIILLLGLPMMAVADQLSYTMRKAEIADKEQMIALYKRVTSMPGGLVRTPAEITESYIAEFTFK